MQNWDLAKLVVHQFGIRKPGGLLPAGWKVNIQVLFAVLCPLTRENLIANQDLVLLGHSSG